MYIVVDAAEGVCSRHDAAQYAPEGHTDKISRSREGRQMKEGLEIGHEVNTTGSPERHRGLS